MSHSSNNKLHLKDTTDKIKEEKRSKKEGSVKLNIHEKTKCQEKEKEPKMKKSHFNLRSNLLLVNKSNKQPYDEKDGFSKERKQSPSTVKVENRRSSVANYLSSDIEFSNINSLRKSKKNLSSTSGRLKNLLKEIIHEAKQGEEEAIIREDKNSSKSIQTKERNISKDINLKNHEKDFKKLSGELLHSNSNRDRGSGLNQSNKSSNDIGLESSPYKVDPSSNTLKKQIENKSNRSNRSNRSQNKSKSNLVETFVNISNKSNSKNNNFFEIDDFDEEFYQTSFNFDEGHEFRKIIRQKLIIDSDPNFSEDEDETIKYQTHEDSIFMLEYKSSFIEIWQFSIQIITYINIIYFPIIVAFSSSLPSLTFMIYDLFVDIVFIFDLVIPFFHPFKNVDDIVVRDFFVIFHHYFYGSFFINLISAIPIGAVTNFQFIHFFNEDISLTIPKLGILFEVFKFIKLYKGVKLPKAIKNLLTSTKDKEMESSSLDDLILSTSLLRLIKFIVIFLLVTHVFSCSWIFVGSLDFPNWIFKANLQNSSNVEVYIASLYFTWTTIFTVGYGDITPGNFYEILYTLVLELLGVMFYTFSLSSLGNLLSSYDKKTSKYIEDLELAGDITSKYQLEDGLSEKIFNCLKYTYKHDKSDMLQFLYDLPNNVKRSILLEVYKSILTSFKFFKYSRNNVEFQSQVILVMKPVKSLKGELLINEYELVEEIFFVKKGRITISTGLRYKEEKIIDLRKGEHFGDILVFTKQRSQIMAKVSSLTAELFLITKHDYEQILKSHLSTCKKILRISSFNYISVLQRVSTTIKKFQEIEKKEMLSSISIISDMEKQNIELLSQKKIIQGFSMKLSNENILDLWKAFNVNNIFNQSSKSINKEVSSRNQQSKKYTPRYSNNYHSTFKKEIRKRPNSNLETNLKHLEELKWKSFKNKTQKVLKSEQLPNFKSLVSKSSSIISDDYIPRFEEVQESSDSDTSKTYKNGDESYKSRIPRNSNPKIEVPKTYNSFSKLLDRSLEDKSYELLKELTENSLNLHVLNIGKDPSTGKSLRELNKIKPKMFSELTYLENRKTALIDEEENGKIILKESKLNSDKPSSTFIMSKLDTLSENNHKDHKIDKRLPSLVTIIDEDSVSSDTENNQINSKHTDFFEKFNLHDISKTKNDKVRHSFTLVDNVSEQYKNNQKSTSSQLKTMIDEVANNRNKKKLKYQATRLIRLLGEILLETYGTPYYEEYMSFIEKLKLMNKRENDFSLWD